MAFINYNGKFIDESNPIIQANNRGFRFGDGIFETMKFKKAESMIASGEWVIVNE